MNNNTRNIGSTRRRVIKSAAVFAAAAALGPRGAFSDTRDIRVVLPSFGLTMIPTLIASDNGFDQAAGMNFVYTQAAGSIGMKAMLAGEFDFSLSAGAAVSAAVSGAPVRTIVVHVAKSFYYLFSKRSIARVEDLAGKSVGVGAIGDSTDVAARAALLAAGVDPSNVNFVAMGIDNVPTALVAGALDAGVVTPPRDIMVERTGNFTNLKFLGDFQPTPSSGVATTLKMITEQPELVQRFVNVVMRGHRLLLENKTGGVASIEKHLRMSTDDAALAWDRYVEQFTRDGLVSADLQSRIVKDQVDQLKPRGKPTPETVFAMHFAERAK